jgi:ABC-type transport system substrate-binding protein
MAPFFGRHGRRLAAAAAVLALLGAAVAPSVSFARARPSVAPAGVFTEDFTSDFPTLDPVHWSDSQSAIPMEAIYQTLVTYGANGSTIVPDAATWSVSPTGLTYTFNLRKAQAFANGDPLTAQDVVYSLNRVTSWNASGFAPAPFGSAYSDIVGYTAWFNGGRPPAAGVEGLSGVTAPNESTVVIHLVRPQAYFLNELALPSAAILDPSVVNSYGAVTYQQHAVGSGPYGLVSWRQGSDMVLEPNPYYSGPNPPKLAQVIFVVGIPYAAQLAQFEAGQVDAIWQPDEATYLTALHTAALKKDLETQPGDTIWYFALNTSKAPFNKQDVRLAVNYAINRTSVLRLLDGTGSVMTQPLPPANRGYEKGLQPYKYDPALAKELLAKAGYPHGFTVTLVNTDGALPESLSYNIQAQLAKVGITVTLQFFDQAALYLSYIENPKNPFGMAFDGWTELYPDPQAVLFNTLDGQNVGGLNIAAWRNTAFDALVQKADTLPSSQEAERLKLYDQAQAVEIQQAPWVPMYYQAQTALVQPWVAPRTESATLPYLSVKPHSLPRTAGQCGASVTTDTFYAGDTLRVCVSGRETIGSELKITGEGMDVGNGNVYGLALFAVDRDQLPVGCMPNDGDEGALWVNNPEAVHNLTVPTLAEVNQGPFSVSTYVPLTSPTISRPGPLEICAYSQIAGDTAARSSLTIDIKAR